MSKNVTYLAAAYKRLSQDDGNGEVSNSIKNQTELIREYAKNHKDIRIVAEYDDDGYSGTSFDRPGFQKMMEDIKARKVNCVIIKDLSRFGRNYIEAGKYIERIFPFMGVRFISINDHYDSAGPKNESDTLMLPFKNLVNDAYCRDISVKIRSQLDVKRKKGECISSFAAYGYKKAEDDKNMLVVDEYAAQIVQTIYQMKMSGINQQKIADFLNENSVLSPMEYKKSQGLKFASPFKTHQTAKWSVCAVNRILTNEIYTGTMVQGKTSTPNYKVHTPVAKKQEEWVRVEGTHEGIISIRDFQMVQELLKRDTRTSPNQKDLHLFSGYVYCADCKNAMVRKTVPSGKHKYHYLVCSGYKGKNGCTSHMINEEKLKTVVLNSVKTQIEIISELDRFLEYVENLPEQQRNVFNYDEQIRKVQTEIERMKRMKLKLYEDLSDGIINEEEYKEYRDNFTERISEKEMALQRLNTQRDEVIRGNRGSHPWIETFLQYKKITELNREVVTTLIHKIYVDENGNVEVVFRHADELQLLIGQMEDTMQEAEAM